MIHGSNEICAKTQDQGNDTQRARRRQRQKTVSPYTGYGMGKNEIETSMGIETSIGIETSMS